MKHKKYQSVFHTKFTTHFENFTNDVVLSGFAFDTFIKVFFTLLSLLLLFLLFNKESEENEKKCHQRTRVGKDMHIKKNFSL